MKKLLLILSVAFILVSFNKIIIDDCFVKGSVKGINDGEIIYLKESNENQELKTLDSTIIKNGKFDFNIKTTEPKLCVLFHKDINGIPFIVEKGTVSVEITKDGKSNNAKVVGTYNNDEMQKIVNSSKLISEKMNDFQSKNMSLYQKASEEKDEATLIRIKSEYETLQKEYSNSFVNYAETNPNSFVSALILESLVVNPAIDFARIVKIFNSLSNEIKNTKQGKKVNQLINEIETKNQAKNNLNINGIAPNFSAKSPEGKTISLNESLGKVTIIDFWASWCGPCRRENPSVVALYNEFHSKGLNIIGVSLDQDLNKWKEAIVKDKITWTQVSNIKGWQDPIAKLYNIESIPQTYILDSNGKIVAKDLRGEQLKAKIKELLDIK